MNKIYLLTRCTLAAIFFYHGLVPKIIFGDPTEVKMNERLMPMVNENFALIGSGVLEVVFAILILVFYRVKLFNYAIIGFGIVATLTILFALPQIFTHAFNPFSTNLSIVILATINLMACYVSQDKQSEKTGAI